MPNYEDSIAFQHLDSLIDSLLGSLEINIGNSLDAFQTSSNSSGTDSVFDGLYHDEIWSNRTSRPAGVFGWNYYTNNSAGLSSVVAGDSNNVHNRLSNCGGSFTPSISGNVANGVNSNNYVPQLNLVSNSRVSSLNGATIVNGVNLASLKFVKPAPQCYYWESRQHRIEQPNCRLWHPRELCKYYPKCTLSAEVCGFGHPFCGEYCECDPNNRSLQVNHRMTLSYKLSANATRRSV